ncbi:MAG: lytic transglycosylase domain-containing protein [Candidatus Binatia bacterium]
MSVNPRNLAALLISFALVACFFSEAKAGMYQCRNADGTSLFTNSPAQPGCRLLGGAYTERSPASVADPARFDDFIFTSSNRYGVDPALVRAVVKVESDFNEAARSHKGAQGLMQLMPDTARLHNVGNAYDPEENIEGGVRHLRLLLDHYRGDVPLTLAAYNAGIKAVEKHRGIPPYSETKEYVRRVLNFHQRYSKNGQIAVNEGSRVQQQ